jgi:RNA polymerase-binding transcription factor DksA
MLSQEFINEMKQKLEERKLQLLEDLKGYQPHTEMGTDYDENASEFEVDAANQDMMFRIKDDLEKIDKALGKIEAGTYGVDDEGQEISEERLRVIPWADKAL